MPHSTPTRSRLRRMLKAFLDRTVPGGAERVRVFPRLSLRAVQRSPALFRLIGRYEGPERAVVSPGGVGTTFLIDHVSRFAEVNDTHDLDGLKHIPRLPLRMSVRPKILFIHGDDASIYASISRRGWVAHQGAKLGSLKSVVLSGSRAERAFRAAVRAQIDAFRNERRADVLMVEYDDIWSRAGEIGAFLGISDPRFLGEFPERKARTSVAADGGAAP